MRKVVSKDSVIRGNAYVANGIKRGVSIDAKNVSVRRRTTTGVCMMTFSRDSIVREANKAFAKVVK